MGSVCSAVFHPLRGGVGLWRSYERNLESDSATGCSPLRALACGFYEDCKRDIEFSLTFFYILIFSVEVTSSQIVVFVCGVGMYHGSILNSPFLAGGPSGRSRKTCFYPWKACPSHKVLNPRMPVKGERTGYKLRNGIGGPNRGTSPSIQNAFCCCL